jgi:hypothetical protein
LRKRRIIDCPVNHINHVFLLVFHSAALYRRTRHNINL